MYIIVFLSLVAYAASVDIAQCSHRVNPRTLRCCATKNKDKVEKFLMSPELKECFEISRNPNSCEREMCIAKKRNFATDDGKLDMEKLEAVLKDCPELSTDIFDNIKTNCIDGDLEMYGPPEFCDFVKMKRCIIVQHLTGCPEWDDKDDCKGTKELVEECAKLYSQNSSS